MKDCTKKSPDGIPIGAFLIQMDFEQESKSDAF